MNNKFKNLLRLSACKLSLWWNKSHILRNGLIGFSCETSSRNFFVRLWLKQRRRWLIIQWFTHHPSPTSGSTSRNTSSLRTNAVTYICMWNNTIDNKTCNLNFSVTFDRLDESRERSSPSNNSAELLYVLVFFPKDKPWRRNSGSQS